jgi:hypothetical protein
MGMVPGQEHASWQATLRSRGDVAWPVTVGVLVLGAVDRIVGDLLDLMLQSMVGDPKKLDDLGSALYGAASVGGMFVIGLAAAWLGGRAARRTVRDAECLPHVARAYAWVLVLLSILLLLGMIMWLTQLHDLRRHVGISSTVVDVPVAARAVAATLLIFMSPFAGRAGVIGMRQRGRGVSRRGAST